MVVFPNGRSGEELAKIGRKREIERKGSAREREGEWQSEPHRRRYRAERADLFYRCKSFTPDAKMIKGFFRICGPYLHVWSKYMGIRGRKMSYRFLR